MPETLLIRIDTRGVARGGSGGSNEPPAQPKRSAEPDLIFLSS